MGDFFFLVKYLQYEKKKEEVAKGSKKEGEINKMEGK